MSEHALKGIKGRTSDMEDWWGLPSEEGQNRRQGRPRYRDQQLPPSRNRKRASARQLRQARLSRTLFYATMAMLVICLFWQIGRYAQISAQTKRISNLVTEISRLEADQEYLSLCLSTRKDLQKIQARATNELGMDYPKEAQRRTVSIPALSVVSTNAQTAGISADSAQ